MRATKWMLALILIGAMAAAGSAQQGQIASLSLPFPVPAWPTNGVIPPDMKDHYVFLDSAKNEYVVAYPENLGSPNFEKDGPAQRTVVRYKLQMDVDPKVTVAVTSANGKYKYAYTVADGPKAKQSIDQFVIAMPESGGDGVAKAPAGWFGVIQRGRKLSVSDPKWIKTGAAVVYSFNKADEQIQPGARKGGFEVESDLKPGFTIGYFRAGMSTDAVFQQSGNIPYVVVHNATPPPPPAGAAGAGGGGGGGFGGNNVPAGATTAWQPIKDDIDKLLLMEYNSKPALTLAPKFDKSQTDKDIAADFMQGISFLSRSGLLAADSAFAKSAVSDLDSYVKAGGSGPLKLSAQPKGDAETEIFNAMKLSLHLN